jgi:hypothetical protein
MFSGDDDDDQLLHVSFLLAQREEQRRKSGNNFRSGGSIFNECTSEQHVFELSESTTGDWPNVNMLE